MGIYDFSNWLWLMMFAGFAFGFFTSVMLHWWFS